MDSDTQGELKLQIEYILKSAIDILNREETTVDKNWYAGAYTEDNKYKVYVAVERQEDD